jgi:hypothetical protein
MLTMDEEKVRPALQCQTDRKEINSRIIIPQETESRPVCLWGFIGSVKEFRQFLKFQRVYLNAGIIHP